MQRPPVSVIIVTYNSAKYIGKCLESLKHGLQSNDEVIIVDNNSSDNTLEIISRLNIENLRVLKLRKNIGFPLACNIGAIEAKNNLLLFMNPDVIVPSGECIDKLVENFMKYKDVGGVQPKIYNAYTKLIDGVGGFMDILGHGFHLGEGEVDRGQYDEKMNILYATFACAMVEKRVYFKAGGMDNYFFLYNEDLDLALRIWLLGYRIVYEPRASAYHIGQHSTKRKPYISLYFGRRNRLLTVASTYPILIALIAISLLIATYVIGSFISWAVSRDKKDSFTFIKSVLGLWRNRDYIRLKRTFIASLPKKNTFYDLLRMGLIKTKLIGLTLYIRGVYRSKLFRVN